MTNLNAFKKHALLAVVLGAAGLPASMANAQFKVEYKADAKAELPAEAQDGSHVVVIKSNDSENKYEVKLVDGIVKFAEMNGKEIDHDRIKMEGNIIVFLSEDGKTITEIDVPNVAEWKHDAPKNYSWSTKDGEVGEYITVNQQQVTPKVMLGEPSDAVRKQLKLGDRKAIFVERVIDGLPAKKAGLETYDVIVSIDGSEYANGELLSKILSKKSPGDPLKLVVMRGGEKLKIKAELAAYDGVKLGATPVVVETQDLAEGHAWPTRDNIFELHSDFGPELHEKIHEALRKSGVNEEQMAKVTEQLHEHLSGLSSFWAHDGDEDRFVFAPKPNSQGQQAEYIARLEGSARDRVRELQERELQIVELARERSEQAMRAAQNAFELHEGRLVIREVEEEMEDHLSELEDRLSELEDRLEAQMDAFESQMDRMADLFERLLDRLEAAED